MRRLLLFQLNLGAPSVSKVTEAWLGPALGPEVSFGLAAGSEVDTLARGAAVLFRRRCPWLLAVLEVLARLVVPSEKTFLRSSMIFEILGQRALVAAWPSWPQLRQRGASSFLGQLTSEGWSSLHVGHWNHRPQLWAACPGAEQRLHKVTRPLEGTKGRHLTWMSMILVALLMAAREVPCAKPTISELV